jgi:tRNA(Ile)-lysidine synthase
MSWGEVDQALAERFRRDIDRLVPAGQRIGLAVSGGPDSLALLVLAHETRPLEIEVATVDHGLRPESSSEAQLVASFCATEDIPHDTLRPKWSSPPRTAIQEKARVARYVALGGWAVERSLAAIVTAHHREDQAETLLMRLTRGYGVRGLAGMRSAGPLPGYPGLRLIRPLLSWSKRELQQVCTGSGIHFAEDPSNQDANFERVRVRQALNSSSWLDAEAVARSAAQLGQADEALEWATEVEWSQVGRDLDGGFSYRPTAPQEIRRRIVVRILGELGHEGCEAPRGREVERLMVTLDGAGTGTLRGVRCSGGATWLFRPAPARAKVRPKPH